MIHDHYLSDDIDQVTVHLETLHKAAMNILQGATGADFNLAETSRVQMDKSLNALLELNEKSLNSAEESHIDYMRRHYF